MTQKPATLTVYDAGVRRRAEASAWETEADAAQAEKARIAGILAAHPEIGCLMVNGRMRYYVMRPNGDCMRHADPAALVNFLDRA